MHIRCIRPQSQAKWPQNKSITGLKHMQIECNLCAHFNFKFSENIQPNVVSVQFLRSNTVRLQVILCDSDFCRWSLLAINHCLEFKLQFKRCKSAVKALSSSACNWILNSFSAICLLAISMPRSPISSVFSQCNSISAQTQTASYLTRSKCWFYAFPLNWLNFVREKAKNLSIDTLYVV